MTKIDSFNARRGAIHVYFIFGFDEEYLKKCVNEGGCSEAEMFDESFSLQSAEAQLGLLVSILSITVSMFSHDA